MFRESSINVIDAEWTEHAAATCEQAFNGEAHEIDRALRRIAKQQATLDAELSEWLRRGDELNIWPQLGYVHALAYLEDVFGFGPHAGTERLRVARELGELPELEAALSSGEVKFGVVRELTRVATRDTEGRWLQRARGRLLREVEQMVAGRKKGDGPDARPDPNRIKHAVRLELDGESMAAWRQMRMAFEDELGERLDDRTFVLELARRYLAEGAHASGSAPPEAIAASDGDGEDKQRSCKPMHMIHYSKCRDCRRAWQHGGGVAIEISASALEHAECDAIIVDDEKGERAAWSISPATKRLVMERDHWCCQVPGCRAARFLAVHHIIHREHGGTNDPWNLLVLCSGHHRLHHDGVLQISGRAPDQLEFSRRGVSLLPAALQALPAAALVPVPRSPRASNENIQLARAALQQLGFTAPVAKRAVDEACAPGGTQLDLAALIREALRNTPRR